MEIPNLNSNPQPLSRPVSKFSFKVMFLILLFSAVTGLLLSYFMPLTKNSSGKITLSQQQAISTDTISSVSQIQVGKLYGDTNTTFKDSATGTIEKGSINGVGTHILNREGGVSQRASLTSSVVDLDLFVGKKVEVKGETNSSPKTAWLMDVGSVKVLE